MFCLEMFPLFNDSLHSTSTLSERYSCVTAVSSSKFQRTFNQLHPIESIVNASKKELLQTVAHSSSYQAGALLVRAVMELELHDSRHDSLDV